MMKGGPDQWQEQPHDIQTTGASTGAIVTQVTPNARIPDGRHAVTLDPNYPTRDILPAEYSKLRIDADVLK